MVETAAQLRQRIKQLEFELAMTTELLDLARCGSLPTDQESWDAAFERRWNRTHGRR